MNPFREINWRPDAGERRRFAASLVVGFPGVAAGLLVAARLRGDGWSWTLPLAVGGAGMALGAILWAVPQIARPFYVVWYGVACAFGFVVGNTVLAAIHLLLFTPVGLTMRALGRRPLRKGFDRDAASYWHEAPPPDAPERYYRQF